MTITRKQFIKASSLLAGGLIFQGERVWAGMLKSPSGFREIRDNVGIYSERGGTIGWFVSDDALLIVDTQFPETAKNMMTGIKEKSSRKIDVLFNTHHHGDHTSGNIYLKDFTNRIVAHENCPELQRKRYGSGKNADKQVYANETYKNTWQESFGKDRVVMFHVNPAHTGGDSVIHFEDRNIAHLGDLVFNRVYPFVNLVDDASLSGWVKYLEFIENKFDNDTIFIFGHAASTDQLTGSLKDVNHMKNYLSALLEFTEKKMKAGMSKEKISKAESIPGFEDHKGMWDGALKANIETAYDELKSD
ncbi:MAG: MBL fold metallo-hydrolase [Melioribacteraceae bacterium]|nr:MBL fold metallo-hydrolase [Melioribacteraceae bacterium]MCF8353604.1 MBL fold metallo-hydrolase [Melioribacteraceae bacterium]MCF8393527.1 MBL fold metallo-hydrolase [Melioribacteraceae bacterium]MCF8419337.1 MBL fold metallo-hydrolase [Melioribacteraceae bacterium]